MKNKLIYLGLTLFVLFVLNHSAMAQPGFDDDVTDTPIDGGILLLSVASIGLGLKKVLNKSKL